VTKPTALRPRAPFLFESDIMIRPRTDQHREMPVSQADLARRRAVNRSTVSRAVRGPLKAAMLPGGRIDAAHPTVRAWLGRGEAPTAPGGLMLEETAPTVDEFAAERGGTREDVERECPAALIPRSHLDVKTFAFYVGATVGAVVDAAEGALKPAVTPAGRLDLAHPASLQFAAQHPFGKTLPPTGILAAAAIGDDIDLEHPVAIVFLARSWGRVPTAAELRELNAA
jgi:hypothetical protein